MSVIKHTPGPYHIVSSDKHPEARFIRTKKGNTFVGKVYGHDGQPVDDNAMLFAIAPELLNVFRDMLRESPWMYTGTDTECFFCSHPFPSHKDDCVFRKMEQLEGA
jgi:hypothetical protein